MSHNINRPLFPEYESVTVSLSRQEHLTFKANRELGRHGWLRLTPAYSVHLVEDLVAHCTQRDVVLDPFCGTGTTALVCAQHDIPCHTVDINPFLVWLTYAKCSAYTQEDIETARMTLLVALAESSGSCDLAWKPAIKDIEKWWEPSILACLAQLFEKINSALLPASARDLLRIIFCRAAIDLAEVSFGHQSMSFKKANAAPRLFELSPEERLRTTFKRVEEEVLRSAGEAIQADAVQAFLGDSRELHTLLPRERYTSVITSPPYPNRMSYIRELRPYMYWLGYLMSGREAGELDWQAIGGTWGCATSNLLKWTPDTRYRVPDAAFQETVERISQQSKVLGLYVNKYFQDTVQHIESLKQVVAPGAKIAYIIGNSKFYDVLLPTERIYAAIFREQGFQDVQIVPIRKRSSKKELFEHLISARA